MPTLQSLLGSQKKGAYAFFPGISLCCCALFATSRHNELMQLLDQDPHPIWPDLMWGRSEGDACVAAEKKHAGLLDLYRGVPCAGHDHGFLQQQVQVSHPLRLVECGQLTPWTSMEDLRAPLKTLQQGGEAVRHETKRIRIAAS